MQRSSPGHPSLVSLFRRFKPLLPGNSQLSVARSDGRREQRSVFSGPGALRRGPCGNSQREQQGRCQRLTTELDTYYRDSPGYAPWAHTLIHSRGMSRAHRPICTFRCVPHFADSFGGKFFSIEETRACSMFRSQVREMSSCPAAPEIAFEPPPCAPEAAASPWWALTDGNTIEF